MGNIYLLKKTNNLKQSSTNNDNIEQQLTEEDICESNRQDEKSKRNDNEVEVYDVKEVRCPAQEKTYKGYLCLRLIIEQFDWKSEFWNY